MDAVLQNVNDIELTADKFDGSVAAMTQYDHYYEIHEASGERTATTLKPSAVAERLSGLLTKELPGYTAAFNRSVKENGRPSRLIRYWLPASMLVVCSVIICKTSYDDPRMYGLTF